MSDQVIYTVGGTVQASGGIYISRDADEELLRLCRKGEFCYVLTARQMGKSSLMVATRERLAAEGIRSVEIDLTQMGTELSGLTAERWYLGLVDLIVDQLDLDVDYVAWWGERAHLGPIQRLGQFLRQVVLEQVSEPVVIFIDEIDSTLNLDFTDDFFAAIRACYNARARDPVFKRLSFVLLGVATPGDLISDPQRTPFNIGRWMDLTDFTERQAIPLASGLGLPPVEAGQALTWILDWTGGHPYLTQRLCAAVAASPTKDWDVAAVEKLVEETFFGEQSAQDSNLRFVRDMLTQRAPDKAAVLKTYRRIHAGKAVPDEERSPVKTHLKLSGIIKAKDRCLHIRNEIYRRVFDLAWVRENTAVNWAPIVAGIAVFVALLAVGFILYNAWVGIQFQDCIANFYQTNAPEERVTHLAKILRLQGLVLPTDYDYQARELFYGLSRKEQLALFNISNTEESDLIVLIKGLYITLADTDGTDSTRPLLEAMVQALDYLDETEETSSLRNEINNWLEGRKLAKQNLYAGALAEYDKAIALNGENPATLYERARVLIELSEYQQALRGLDQVMAIARRAPAPTPTVSPTLVASSTLTPEPTTSPMLTPTSTSTPGTDITPTETSPPASVTATSVSTPIPTATPTPAAIISEFATTGQMISAVRNIIDGNPDLVSSLASAPNSEYPNLREFGLVPILTPTPVPTPSLTHTPTQVGIVVAPSPTPTQVPISTPTGIISPTPTATVTFTPLPINTPTSILMATVTLTPLPTNTPTRVPTATVTLTPLPTNTPTPAVIGKIAFPVFDLQRETYDIFIANADGTGRQKIKEEASQPCLSPDGTQIAYRSWRSDKRGLIWAETFGDDLWPITGLSEASRPSVSRGGIVYHLRPASDSSAYIYLFPGSGEPEVIRWGDDYQPLLGESPAWVSGERLVYQSCARGICGLYLTEGVHDGIGITRITDEISDINPEVSPDGKKVAFMSRRDLNWEIYMMSLDSYTVKRLTENAANDGLPIWSPDGRTIAFASDRSGEWAVWAMNPGGSSQRMLFPLGGSLHGYVWNVPLHQRGGWEEERLSWSR